MLSTSPRRSGEESKHFTSLQIFTSYAEPPLEEYLDKEEQVGWKTFYGVLIYLLNFNFLMEAQTSVKIAYLLWVN